MNLGRLLSIACVGQELVPCTASSNTCFCSHQKGAEQLHQGAARAAQLPQGKGSGNEGGFCKRSHAQTHTARLCRQGWVPPACKQWTGAAPRSHPARGLETCSPCCCSFQALSEGAVQAPAHTSRGSSGRGGACLRAPSSIPRAVGCFPITGTVLEHRSRVLGQQSRYWDRSNHDLWAMRDRRKGNNTRDTW